VPPNITLKFTDIETEPDKDYRYSKIFDAWVVALRSLLGREPTQDEIFGLKSIRSELESHFGGGKAKVTGEMNEVIEELALAT
jgi:hypothetical protein